MKLLIDYARQITDPMFDVCGDTALAPGQRLTVLELAKNVLDIEIARLQEAVESNGVTESRKEPAGRAGHEAL